MFDVDYAIAVLPALLRGMVVTLYYTILGMSLAVVIGMLLALGRRSKAKYISMPTGWFVEFIRSTPFLVQLYFVFFVLPASGIRLTPFVAGVIGLGVHYSAYTSEVYRAGIEAVPRHQWEAAVALGLSKLRTWTSIILPQAIPPMVPVLGNYLIAMFKEPPQLSAITVVEMLSVAKLEASHSFRYMEPFTMVGMLFLLLSFPSARVVRALERRFGSVV